MFEPSTNWQQLSVVDLAQQYDARGTVPDVQPYLDAYRQASAPLYQQLPCETDVRYGPHPSELLDIFPVPGQPLAPVFVFIHGGYWRALGKQDSVFMARNFTQRGVAVVAIDYALSPSVGLEVIVAQCRRALGWLHQHGQAHGLNAQRMVLGGSSAGAHLVAMLLSQGWRAAAGVPPTVAQAAVLVSGLFDLAPVQQTTPNQWLQLDPTSARALSPLHDLPTPGARLCIATAATDTAEFKRQSAQYASACAAHGCSVQTIDVPARNHFDVIMEWMDAEAPLTQHTWALTEG